MASPTASQGNQAVLHEIRALQQRGAFAEACAALANQIEQILEYVDWSAVQELAATFPDDFRSESTDLRYVLGFVYARAGQVQEAINLLERARFSYTITDQNYARAVSCCLELARILHSRENFRTAYYYLHEVAQPLLEQNTIADLPLRARFYLRLSEISPDIGQLQASVEYAQQALAIYQTLNDLPGRYYALVRIAGASVHLGDHAEAESKLELARLNHTIGNLGPLARARLLNLETHLHWYRGRLFDAMRSAQAYLQLADGEAYSNFRVYARILIGNLYRGLGQFQLAQQWYTATRQMATTLDYHRYYPWIDVQLAWLRILEGRFDEGRSLLHTSLQTSDLGQAISYQVFLAVLNLLENQVEVGERLLRESLAYYTASGDQLSVCALRFYLALGAIRRRDEATAVAQLQLALAWLARQRSDYFPHWWHSGLVGEVCAYALVADIYPEVIERIFANHLGEAGVLALRRLKLVEPGAARTRVQALLQLLDSLRGDELAHLPDSASKRVLRGLLQEGLLRRAEFARLQEELTTARLRRTPNATVLAVFGLYVNGYSRTQIAERVECSLENVRNYITLIYHQFGLPSSEFHNRRERWRRLVELARERGFIG
jgi:tetratricopeptide (TPR) repeat protein